MPRWLLLGGAVAASLLLVLMLQMEEPVPPAVASSEDTDLPSVTTEPEEWVRGVARAGKGRVQVLSDSDGTVAAEQEIRSLGPLSVTSRRSLERYLDRKLSRLEERLLKTVEAQPLDALRELRILRTIETYMIVREHLQQGNYITIEPGEPIPQRPRSCTDVVFSQHSLEAPGREGVPVFWVNPELHDQLEKVTDVLRETAEGTRLQRIMEFNGTDYSDRREWVDDYLSHARKVGESGIGSLSAEELRIYWSKRTQLRELGAEIVAEHAILIPSPSRRGPAPR